MKLSDGVGVGVTSLPSKTTKKKRKSPDEEMSRCTVKRPRKEHPGEEKGRHGEQEQESSDIGTTCSASMKDMPSDIRLSKEIQRVLKHSEGTGISCHGGCDDEPDNSNPSEQGAVQNVESEQGAVQIESLDSEQVPQTCQEVNGFYRGQEDEVKSREDMVTEPLSEIRVTGISEEGGGEVHMPGLAIGSVDGLKENGEELEAEGYAHEQELLRKYKNDDRFYDYERIMNERKEYLEKEELKRSGKIQRAESLRGSWELARLCGEFLDKYGDTWVEGKEMTQ